MLKWVSLYCPHTSISTEAINVEGGKVAGLFAVESWNQSREVPGPSSDGSHYWETAPLVNSSHRVLLLSTETEATATEWSLAKSAVLHSANCGRWWWSGTMRSVVTALERANLDINVYQYSQGA